MSNIKQITVNNTTYNLLDTYAARSKVLETSDDLNSVLEPGIYSCGGGNSIKNKPNGTDGIGVIVVHNATGNYYTQILTTSSNANTYRRTCINGTWSGWTVDKYTDTNTDTKVTQTAIDSTYTAYRPVLLGASSGSVPTFVPTTTTSDVKALAGIYVKPDQGLLHATTFEGNLSGTASNASTVNGHTVGVNVPANAKFTDTTYSAATQSAAGLMSKDDKIKLDGIAAGANKYTYTLPTAGSSVLGGVKVGTTLSVSSDGKIDVVTSKLVTAGTSAAGLMSAADKKKLDHIAANANNYTYTLPDATTTVKGGVKIGSNLTVSGGTISLTKSNVTSALGYTPPTTNTTYGAATNSTLGLVKIGGGLNVTSGLITAASLAMGQAGIVPGTPSVSDTSNQNRYLSGGTDGKGQWRTLPNIAWNGSGLGKSFKQYVGTSSDRTLGCVSVPSNCGTAITAPTVNEITSTSGRYYGVESDYNNRLFVNVPWVNTVGVTGTAVSRLRVLTPSQYNALTSKNIAEIYFILE